MSQTTEATEAQLYKKTVAQLRKQARELGISSVSSARKADIVPLIAVQIEAERNKSANAALEDLIKQEEAADAPEPQPKPKPRKSSKCYVCGERRIDKRTQGRDSTMCTVCFEYAGWENTHSDNGHEQEWGQADPECPVCFEVQQSTPVATAEVGKKAVRFAEDARKAGWTALARNGSDPSVSIVTARRGDEELTIVWDGSACRNTGTTHKGVDGRVRKVRNASAARKILAS